MTKRIAERTSPRRPFIYGAIAIGFLLAGLAFVVFRSEGEILDAEELNHDDVIGIADDAAPEAPVAARRRDATDALDIARKSEESRARRRVSGTVVDADGQPADGTAVRLVAIADAVTTSADPTIAFTPTPVSAEAIADAEGRFEIVAPEEGRFLIVAQRGTAEFGDFLEIAVPANGPSEILLTQSEVISCIALDHEKKPSSGAEIAVLRRRRSAVRPTNRELLFREIVRTADNGIFEVPGPRGLGRSFGKRRVDDPLPTTSLLVRRHPAATERSWWPYSAAVDDTGRPILEFERTTPLTIVPEFIGDVPPERFLFTVSLPRTSVSRTFESLRGASVVWPDCPGERAAVVDVRTESWQLTLDDPKRSKEKIDAFSDSMRVGLFAGTNLIPPLDENPRILKLAFDHGRSTRVKFVDDATQKPVGRIAASVTHFGRDDSRAIPGSDAVSGSDGVAEFRHLPLGPRYLTIETLDWAIATTTEPPHRSWASINGGSIVSVDVDSTDGRRPSTRTRNQLVNVTEIDASKDNGNEPVEIRVVKSPSLIGRVVDESGHSVAETAISIRCREEETAPVVYGARPTDVARRTTAVTDAEGRFRIQGFSPGIPCRVDVVADGFYPITVATGALGNGATTDLGEIPLTRDRPWTLRLVRPSGEPLVGAMVVVEPASARNSDRRPESIVIAGGIGPRPGDYRFTIERTDRRGEIIVRGIAEERVAVSFRGRPAGVHFQGGKDVIECTIDPTQSCVIVVEESPVLAGRFTAIPSVRLSDLTVTANPSTIPIEEIEKVRAKEIDIGDPNGTSDMQRRFRRSLRGSTRVAADGTFEIELEARGEYVLEVFGPGINFSREDRTLGGSLLSSVVELYEVDRPLLMTDRVHPPIGIKKIGPRIPPSAVDSASDESVRRVREFFPQYLEN